MKFNHLSKAAFLLLTVAVFTTSCKKDQPAESLPLKKEVAAIPCGYEYPVVGNWGSPYNPSTFGTVYVKLGTSSASQSTTAPASDHQLTFTSRSSSFVFANTGYTLRKLTSIVDICALTASSWTTATAVTTPAGSGVWYSYVSGVATPIPGVVLLVRDDLSGDIWAFNLESATAITNGLPASDPAVLIQGTNTINVRKL